MIAVYMILILCCLLLILIKLEMYYIAIILGVLCLIKPIIDIGRGWYIYVHADDINNEWMKG